MQVDMDLDTILRRLYKVGDNVLEKIKEIVEKPSKYLKDKVKKYEELTRSTPFGILYGVGYKIKRGFEKVKDTISEYKQIIIDSAKASLPYTPKVLISTGLFVKNTYRGLGGRAVGYLLIITGVAALGWFVLSGIHGLPSPNNEHVHYVGSPDGYQGFVPKSIINKDPMGDLILDNGTVIHDAMWHGKYSDTIVQNHNQIVQLNNQLKGEMQDFYVIKGQVPVEQVTINGQTYYVIEADKINPANIAGFYTYDKWVPNFVAAINTPGTYAAVLPGDSPVYKWANTIGTVAYQTNVYGGYGAGPGGYVLVLPNKTIIPYGIPFSPAGSSITFNSPSQVYNPSS